MPEHALQATVLERELRALKRSITNANQRGQAAIQDEGQQDLFEADLATANDDWLSFKRVWNDFTLVQIQLGNKDFPDEKWRSFYDNTRDEIVKGKSTLITIERRKNVTKSTPHDATLQTSTFGTLTRSNLPKIQLPHFSGDLTRWTHFKDTFKSMVHEDPNLSNIERYHYLIGALRGEAASLISGIPVDANSYQLAWDKLTKEYDKPRVLASLFLQRMIDFGNKGFKSDVERYESFLADIADSVNGFKALGITDPGEFVLCFLALRGLDSVNRKEFELNFDSTERMPKADDVVEFVRKRMSAHKASMNFSNKGSCIETKPRLSAAESKFPRRYSPKYFRHNNNYTVKHGDRPNFQHRSYYSLPRDVTPPRTQNKTPCPVCQGCHLLAYCFQFERLPLQERLAFISGWKGCKNCLRQTHTTSQCSSKWRCRICKENHHTLIHPKEAAQTDSKPCKSSSRKQTPSSSKHDNTFTAFGSSSPSSEVNKYVILGTIQGLIKGREEQLYPFRGILDSGSQKTFITGELARRIQAKVHQNTGSIIGLGGTTVSRPAGSTTCTLRSYRENQEFSTEALVVDSISSQLPSSPIDEEVAKKLTRVDLADPSFYQPGPIDILIGMDLYPSIMKGAMYSSGIQDLYLQPTSFGLVVMGSLPTTDNSNEIVLFNDSCSSIQEHLKRFWELEEPITIERISPEDRYCEEHFANTHSRTPEGRYIVRLPLTSSHQCLGNNVEIVTRRLLCLEKRLERDIEMSEKYRLFMQEYMDLEHMSPAKSKSKYLIPHHSVWQHRPGGKKLRVVFDASCPSSNNSLNEILLPGPKLLTELGNILIRFRLFPIPLCADLVKMYRQVLVHEEDRKFQHILWRDDFKDEAKEFELNTLTYGLRPSAFLAMRVIKQLVIDEGVQYPLAVESVKNSMYVDDVVTGADTVEQAIILQNELKELFAKGGFCLGKWASTVPQLIPESENSPEPLILADPESDYIKILGLVWNPLSDHFTYKVMTPPINNVTKRVILSAIARIFDPLGMLAPITLYAKALLQDVWKSHLDWDDMLTPEIAERWSSIAEQWNVLATITFPRHIQGSCSSYLLVGFADASTVGYAATVYLHSTTEDGSVHAALIKAKSKVAPTKYTSVARLELCGALLLARLISSIDIPSLRRSPPRCFTDSSVVLSWLTTPCHSLKTFEANRVNQILDIVPLSSWGHVKSEDNPSDLASRGCLPLTLKTNQLWWHGPHWMLKDISQWPNSVNNTSPEVVLSTTALLNRKSSCDPPDTWMSRFSNYDLLIRTVARILRWNRRARNKRDFPEHIGEEEFRNSRARCVKLVQRHHFPPQLYKANAIPSEFSNLLPFIDESGIIRVGGRLQESSLPYSAKHPVLLPRDSHFAKLIVDDIHLKHFHCGVSLTLSLLRMQWWIPRATNFIKGRILHCVECRIRRAQPLHPKMAPLPKSRFSDSRAFHNTGIDYAGPFLIKSSTRRNAPLDKAYMAIFVCMATKAVHLEAVSALTTAALLAAMDRFFARRGLPKEVWSDHGTNFIGASRYLKDVYTFLLKNDDEIAHRLAPKGVQWKFIPPRAPHFGGLWEAGVKSVKNLLPSTFGKQPFTFEELATALTKIEGILNSRPLCALKEDTDNSDFLTPGHFLIGKPILNLPEQSDCDTKMNPQSRWQLIQDHIWSIWNRWRKEYLHTLQTRTKWYRSSSNLQVGDLVIMVEKRSSIGQWPVARIVEVHPGKDGIIRTVSIKTPAGKIYMRPVASLVRLLGPDEN